MGEIKIQDLVPEGTIVKKGTTWPCWTVPLPTTHSKTWKTNTRRFKENLTNAAGHVADLENLRDDIENQKFNIEEAKIAVEQSIYEPPATQRQYTNNLEKAQRSYEQALNNYDLKAEQAQATVNDVLIELNRKKRQLDELREVLNNFTIYAPNDGMVIYFRDWSGENAASDLPSAGGTW